LIVKRILRKAIPALSLGFAAVNRVARGGGVRILMYHRVTELKGDRLSVRPAEFRKQMDYLFKSGYRVLDLKDLAGLKPGDLSFSPRLILTFDDGYRDFYEHVFPVLENYRFPATVFIVSDLLEGKIQLERYRDCPEKALPLSWEMLKRMAVAGISVGSHSITHRELTFLSREEAELEIRASARIIARRLGQRPSWFAYPRGSFNPGIAGLVKSSGYRGAVTVRPGCNRLPLKMFTLARTEISGDDDLWDFKMKLAGSFDSCHRIWQNYLAGLSPEVK
jgi:peptidoglycan/xylan/chitin deacetylase (PgdA/CDA1 family)